MKLARFFILCFLLTMVSQLAAAEDVHYFIGRPQAVGNDGATEGDQNPAYLVFRKKNESYSLATSHAGAYIFDFKNSAAEISPSPAILYSGRLAFAAYDVFTPGLALSFGFNGADDDAIVNTDAQDHYRRTLSLIKLEGKPNIANVTSETKNTYSVDSTAMYFEGYLAAAYKLDRENSLGLSLQGSYGKRDVINSIDLDLTTSTSGAIKTLVNENISGSVIRMSAILGYVFHTPGFDMGARLKAMTFDLEKGDYSLTTSSTTASDSFTNTILRPPQASLGVSQRFFKFLRLYAEGYLAIPVTHNLSDFTNDSGILTRSILQQYKNDMAVSVGGAVRINEFIRVFAGAKLNQSQINRYITDTESNGTTITRDRQNTTQAFFITTGATFLDYDPWLLFIGAEYFRVFSRATQASSASSSNPVASALTETVRYSGIGVNLGARYALQ